MRLHHVQVACPPGAEDDARRFYVEGLGLTEVEKPDDLKARGGAWFRSYDVEGAVTAEVHVGVEDPFAPARKAHPALQVDSVAALEAVADRLARLGFDVDWSQRHTFPGNQRCHTADGHGNRVELLAPVGPDTEGVVPDDPCQVLWFLGADAVGKSVVGWEAYSRLVAQGVPSAYVDLDHLGFCDPRPDDLTGLVATNLGAVWRGHAGRGIRCLVVSGVVATAEDRDRFAEHLPGCELHLVLLRARPETIAERIVRRREVEAAAQGSTLGAAVLQELGAYASRSARFAELLDRSGITDLSVDTDDQSPERVAARALDATGVARASGAGGADRPPMGASCD